MQCHFCCTAQSVGAACANPECTQHGVPHRYYCPQCHLWENNRSRAVFHCDACGICRVGQRAMYRHCDRCMMCVPKRGAHQCWGTADRCPVCYEDLRSSREQCAYTRCGHALHTGCLREWCARGHWKCPVCMQAIFTTTSPADRPDIATEATDATDATDAVT